MGGMGGGQSKNILLGCMLKNFKKGFNGDYGVKLTPGKLRNFCEIDWPSFGMGWPPEGSLEKVIVNRVFELVVGDPGHPDPFPYIDYWQNAVLSQPIWLKETCSIMVAKVAAASKYREKCKKPEKSILAGKPKETLPLCTTVPTFATAFHLFVSTLGRGSSIRQGSPSRLYAYKAGSRSS
jgi:hypothetical protein